MLTMATQDPLQAHQSHTNHYMKTETPDPSYDYRLGLSAGMDHGHYPPPHHAQYMHGHAFSQVEHMAMANRLPHYSLEALHHDSQHLQHSHHHHGPPLPSHHAHHHSLDGSHNGGGAGGPFSHSHEANLYHHMGVVPSQSSYMDHNLSHVHAGHHSSAQSEMDLEKTYGKPSSNENNHYPSLMPASHSGGVYKNEPAEDPYSFVDEDPMLGQGSHDPNSGDNKNRGMPLALPEPGMANSLNPAPKKRGRKKKVEPEIPEGAEPSPESSSGQPGGKRKYTKSEHYKQRRRHDRFNGMSEEEVKSRTLPDHLIPNLDIVIIGINPGLFAAYKGHHYAGPGNHFWKCLYLAGLVPEPMTADDDFKMVHYGIGFTNMVNRATKGSADLTRKEIREGGRLLQEKLQQFRPKIAVFNGKGIYEVYSGKKDFTFGRQPEFIDGTNTYIWVMPSSSARCAQLPRAMDKVPFYAALKKFRDYLNGLVPEIDDAEVVFNDPRIRNADDGSRLDNLKDDQQQSPEQFPPALQPGAVGGVGVGVGVVGVGTGAVGAVNGLPALPALPGANANLNVDPNLPPKKKRGRPKKIRPEDGGPLPDAPPGASAAGAATVPVPRASSASLAPPVLGPDGTPLKKKRGRPKKIRLDEANKVEPSYVDRGTEQSSSCDGNNGGQLTPTASLTPTSSYPPPLASSSSYASPAFLAQSSVRQSPTRPHSLPHTYHPSPLAMYNQSPSPAHNSSSGSNPASASASQSYDLGCGNEPGRSSSVTGTRSDHTLTPPTQPSPLDPPDFELPSSLPPNDLVAPTSHHSAHHSPHDSDASLHEQPPKLSLATGSYYSNTPNPQQSQPTSATSQQSQPQTPQSQQQQQQQSSAPPPQSARNAYNNGLGAKPNHAGGANQDIATKSLSGLESLVDQIPNLGEHDGPPSLAPQTNFSPNRGPPTHYQPAAFGSYGQSYASAPTSAPPSSTYSSYANAAASGYASYGSPYEHESSFSVPNFGSSFPMAPASGMFGSGTMGPGAASLGMPGLGMPPSTLGYPYSQYPGSPAYTSWNTPGAGLHVPPANYGYPAAYGQPPYPQPGYLNNSVLDRFKHERMDMGFGGY